MLVSPFTFCRGAANIMASDLATTPSSGIRVQLCGDAHLSNFGGFASPERDLVFDINDFDETLPGPWEWDVKRLAASMVVAGRDRGLSPTECHGLAGGVVDEYRTAMRRFARRSNLDVWYARLDETDYTRHVLRGVDRRSRKRYERTVAKARTKDSMRALTRLTHCRACGWNLARAYARSGDRIAIAAFAKRYADQNERDHQAFVAAVESGRLEAQRD